MFERVVTIVVGCGFVFFWTRMAVLRFIHPTDWWQRPWPTLDPYYMEVRQRLKRGKAPPDALESRMRAVADVGLALAVLVVLIAFAIANPS